MSYFDDYAGLYGWKLSPQESVEVGIFAAEIATAHRYNDMAKMASLLKEASMAIKDDEEVELAAGFVEHLHADPFMEKTASIANTAIATAGLALAASPLIMAKLRERATSQAANRSYYAALEEHPSLREDVNAPRYFSIIKSFAPDIAANPLVAGNVMREMQALGPRSITTQRVNELLGLQRSIQDRDDRLPAAVSEFGKSVHNYGKTISKGGDKD